MKEDGTGRNRARDEEVLARYNRLRMISFSRLLVPFYVYNRFFKELSKREISLYDLITLIRRGKGEWKKGEVEVLSIRKMDVLCDSLEEYTNRVVWLYENMCIDEVALGSYATIYNDYVEDEYYNPVIECHYEMYDSEEIIQLRLGDLVLSK